MPAWFVQANHFFGFLTTPLGFATTVPAKASNFVPRLACCRFAPVPHSGIGWPSVLVMVAVATLAFPIALCSLDRRRSGADRQGAQVMAFASETHCGVYWGGFALGLFSAGQFCW
jgi:hypothetical protein